jgi:hypothetical protein
MLLPGSSPLLNGSLKIETYNSQLDGRSTMMKINKGG